MILDTNALSALADGDEGLAEEARIAADEHAVGLGLGLDVGGDSGHGQANIGYSEFVGNNCAPTGGAKFDCCAHVFYFPPWAELAVKSVLRVAVSDYIGIRMILEWERTDG